MEEQKALSSATVNLPQVELNLDDIKKYIAPNATDKELFMFMNIAKSYGLNPFKREVHFIKYGNAPGQTIVGYEIYIKRAEGTGLLDGWEVELGKDEIGEKATITIYRKDRSRPFKWTVYRDEFDKKQANWQSMPRFMLRKVAISQGFRLAFPEELGGLPYIPEEINGGRSSDLDLDNDHNVPKSDVRKPEIVELTDEQRKFFEAAKGDIEAMTSSKTLAEYGKRWSREMKASPCAAELRNLFMDRLDYLKDAEKSTAA